MQQEPGKNFKSSHWDQPNVLAHVRVDDRTDADGKRVLFVQELQSDWGQEGKKKGFGPIRAATEAERKEWRTLDALTAAQRSPSQAARLDELDHLVAGEGDKIAPAPFVTKTDAWVALAIKRVIKMAADGDYDCVAFISGDQAAELFDLSKQVSEIEYTKNPSDGTFNVAVHGLDGQGLVWSKKRATAQVIEDSLGKEMLTKMESGEGRRGPSFSGEYDHSLYGAGLKVGGQGMRTFYDKIVPSVTKDVLRKVGGGALQQVSLQPRGKVVRHNGGLPGFGILGEDGVAHGQWNTAKDAEADLQQIQSGFDITPAMRAKASGGLPLFAAGDATNTAAISKAELDQIISRNLNNWKGIGVNQIAVAETWRDLPEEVIQSAEDMSLGLSKLEGVLHRGRVTLVRGAIKSADQAERILFHEIYGHLGLKAALDGKPRETLDALWLKMNGLAGVAKLAKKHEVAPGKSAWDRLQPYVKGTEYRDQAERRAVIMDELIAYLAQANDTTALTQFKGYLSDMKAAVVKALRRFGLNRLADRLDKAGAELDVLALVREARNSIITGKTKAGNPFVFAVGGKPLNPAFSERDVSQFSARVAELRAQLGALATAAAQSGNTNQTVEMFPVDDQLASEAKEQAGLDISGYRHTVDMFAVRHALNQHGDAAKEASRGQVGITSADIETIATVLSQPEAVVFGAKTPRKQEIVASIKRLADGSLLVVEEVRTGRKTLALTSVRKYPAARDFDSIAQTLLSNAQSDGGDGVIVVNRAASGNQGASFSAQNGFTLPEFGRTGKAIEALQNRYNRWKQAIEAVRQQGGTVTETNDFYQAEERYWGIVGAQLDDFKGEVDAFVKTVQKDGLELADVALYAYAKHAPERNAAIAKINPKFPDGGSGMTDAEAGAILAKAKADGLDTKLERHAATLSQWTEGTRQALLQNGLIDQGEYASWTGAYRHYVPLRGQLNDDGSRRGTGSGFDIRGKESFRAMGRRSQAGHVIEHILQDRARALMRAGKNEVLRRFARFVLDNPDASLWEVNSVERRRSIVQTPTGEQVSETDGINKAPENTVALKDGGQTIYITVKDQVLLEQLKNLNVSTAPVLTAPLHWANRLLSRMYTSLNPVFTVLNGARDITAGAVNMVGVAGFGGSGRMLANLPNAFAEAFRAEVQGKPSVHYDEYRRTGGKTGFMDFKDIEGYAQELAQIASEAQTWRAVAATPGGWATAKAAWRRSRGSLRRVLERIEAYNGAIENMTRYAAFKAARESGMSVAEAANVAKNITVNFNRKGTMTTGLSAWFLFFNPAVQGTARLLEAMKSKQVLATIGAGMGGVFALALANAAMGGDDDDDGMTYWDKIPEETKERNLIIMLPPGVEAGEKVPGTKYGRYIKIPMPYGYNTFAVIAQTAADVLRNQSDPRAGLSMAEGAKRVGQAFIGAWIPVSDVAPSFENAKSTAMAFVPDAIDPIMEAVLNTNSFGNKLYPDSQQDDKVPDSEKVWGAQKHTWKHNAARWMNEATGGSMYHEGAVSLTPATIDNLVRGYGGGAAAFITAVADTAVTQGVARDRIEWWRAPFVKQLYGEVSTMQDQALAYDRLSKIEESAEPLKRARKAGDRAAEAAIRDEFGVFADLGSVSKSARQRLTAIRKNEVRVITSESMTPAEKNASLRQWDRERGQVYNRVNRAYGDALTRERVSAP